MKLEANPYYAGLPTMAWLALTEYVKRKGIRIPARELNLLWKIACNPQITQMQNAEHSEYFGQFQMTLANMLAQYPDETLDVLTYVRRKLKEWRTNPKGTRRIKVLNFFASHSCLVELNGELYSGSDPKVKDRDWNTLHVFSLHGVKGHPRAKDQQISAYLKLGSKDSSGSVKEIREALYGKNPHLPPSMTR